MACWVGFFCSQRFYMRAHIHILIRTCMYVFYSLEVYDIYIYICIIYTYIYIYNIKSMFCKHLDLNLLRQPLLHKISCCRKKKTFAPKYFLLLHLWGWPFSLKCWPNILWRKMKFTARGKVWWQRRRIFLKPARHLTYCRSKKYRKLICWKFMYVYAFPIRKNVC